MSGGGGSFCLQCFSLGAVSALILVVYSVLLLVVVIGKKEK